MTGISIFKIIDGKIAEEWTEFDQLGMMQQARRAGAGGANCGSRALAKRAVSFDTSCAVEVEELRRSRPVVRPSAEVVVHRYRELLECAFVGQRFLAGTSIE
jgi:hypothetical protein